MTAWEEIQEAAMWAPHRRNELLKSAISRYTVELQSQDTINHKNAGIMSVLKRIGGIGKSIGGQVYKSKVVRKPLEWYGRSMRKAPVATSLFTAFVPPVAASSGGEVMKRMGPYGTLRP